MPGGIEKEKGKTENVFFPVPPAGHGALRPVEGELGQ